MLASVGTRSGLVVIALLGAELVASTAAHATTTTFTATGAEQTFIVPADVTSVHVVAVGAPGGPVEAGSHVYSSGGLGARAGASVVVHPGESLYVEVGGIGTPGGPVFDGQGGFNGGGNGGGIGAGGDLGGGGGGATDVRTVAASVGAASLTSRLVIAAGGGGGGYASANGGAAGEPGSPTCSGCAGGGPASRSQGGAGGTGGAGGDTGVVEVGGNGGTFQDQAGGGGGGSGLYGGGGGGAAELGEDNAGGGGGGSSGFRSGLTATSLTADATGMPSVTFTYVKTLSTKTSVTAKHHRRSLSVNGTVKPAAPGVTVKVTLLRKHGSKYKKVATKQAVLTTAGHFRTSFTRPKPGKCEITAVFAGYRSFTASHQTTDLAC